jgi:hypothetical protein
MDPRPSLTLCLVLACCAPSAGLSDDAGELPTTDASTTPADAPAGALVGVWHRTGTDYATSDDAGAIRATYATVLTLEPDGLLRSESRLEVDGCERQVEQTTARWYASGPDRVQVEYSTCSSRTLPCRRQPAEAACALSEMHGLRDGRVVWLILPDGSLRWETASGYRDFRRVTLR